MVRAVHLPQDYFCLFYPISPRCGISNVSPALFAEIPQNCHIDQIDSGRARAMLEIQTKAKKLTMKKYIY